jgi:hypothetical protein
MSLSPSVAEAEKQMREARQRIGDQKARLQRMIVQGAPTQATEDLLAEMYRTLLTLRQGPRIMR